MDTKPLERFATQARRDLLSSVDARATAVLAGGSVARAERPEAVRKLESEIAAHGRAHVIDKVAYTWFNRIIALRFMDARGYTDAGIVSPAQGQAHGQPEILAEAKRGNLDADVVINKVIAETILSLLDGSRRSTDAEGEAYALLLTEYCRYWHKSMPFMFEREGDYTELLVPPGLLADGAILSRAREVLTEDVCDDVEVIGWLYQFYISERKDEVFAGFKKNKKAGADEIPAATQLFTPHWIVRYLVENSVGRLWMLNRPDSRLVDQMQYYIAPVDEETDFLRLTGPEELTVIDPACGSGHMLTYAFDLLYAIYEEEGYGPADIPGLILTHNLHGTEIDPRAGALAAFALTMKARSRQRAFFSKKVEPKIRVIEPVQFSPEEIKLLLAPEFDASSQVEFWNLFDRSDITGSLVRPDQEALEFARSGLAEAHARAGENDLLLRDVLSRAELAVSQAHTLASTYRVAVANPPYMGSANMNPALAEFAKARFPRAKIDLYAMFIERCFDLVGATGSVAMVTQDSWMFLGAYTKYRGWLLNLGGIASLTHLGTAAFDTIGGEVVSTVAFVADRRAKNSTASIFVRAADVDGEAKRDILATAASGRGADRVWTRPVTDFLRIPNTPIVYWASDDELAALSEGPFLGELIQAREGLTTGDNDRFLRRWYEVSLSKIGLGVGSADEGVASGSRWFPYQKGGSSRRWYGNFDFVVDWEDDGRRARGNIDVTTGRVRSHNYNGDFGFRRGFTWSGISGDGFAVRHVDGGFMFDAKGPMAFATREADLLLLEGFLNSSTATRFMRLLAPRLDFKLGHVLSLPIRVRDDARVIEYASRCIELAEEEWNSNELSIDFERSPLIGAGSTLAAAVDATCARDRQRGAAIAAAEEGLDRIFAEAYFGDRAPAMGSRGRLALGDAARNREHVEALVSYAVGWMFGRYSLDTPGLVLADQGATVQDFLSKEGPGALQPDADNVIPLVDDGWFEDDVVERFRQFLRIAFGTDRFEENLRFIEETLGVTTVRDYFITRAGKSRFYDDHVQRYKRRPIYWMFSSPKGSFNALIYMHRYNPSTVSTVLNEYLREYRAKLEVALAHADRAGAAGSIRDQKEADRLRKVLAELGDYEHDVLYQLATQQIAIDLDDGVKANYPKFYPALRKIAGLEAAE